MINHEYGMKTPICKYIVFFRERQAKTVVLPKFSGSGAEFGIIFNPHQDLDAVRVPIEGVGSNTALGLFLLINP
jgi:hypothetical protein